MSIQWYIYCLIDPRNDLIFYVGVSNRPFARLQKHISEGRPRNIPTIGGMNPKQSWIFNLWENNLRPDIRILERVHISERKIKELHWIYYLGKVLGFVLTNYTGQGQYTQYNKIVESVDCILNEYNT